VSDLDLSVGAAGAPIDALAPVRLGRYEDGLVVVERAVGGRPARLAGGVRTAHFDVMVDDRRLRVVHDLDPARVDNDVGDLVAGELVRPGWVNGSDAFERIFTGLVLTSHPDPEAAWDSFYRNTLARLDALLESPTVVDRSAGHGSLAAFAPVHAHAEQLVRGDTVLELGSCFGFSALRLAARGLSVTATEVAPGTVRLLRVMARRLGRDVATAVADATRVPLPDAYADTVLLVHLLEHLDVDDGGRALAEAVRLARRRVVVAVPYEDEPDPAYGHVRTVDAAALHRLGERPGWRADVHDHHGGWLVLDRT